MPEHVYSRVYAKSAAVSLSITRKGNPIASAAGVNFKCNYAC